MSASCGTCLGLRAGAAVTICSGPLRLLEAAVQGGGLGARLHYGLKALARGWRVVANIVRDPLKALRMHGPWTKRLSQWSK